MANSAMYSVQSQAAGWSKVPVGAWLRSRKGSDNQHVAFILIFSVAQHVLTATRHSPEHQRGSATGLSAARDTPVTGIVASDTARPACP